MIDIFVYNGRNKRNNKAHKSYSKGQMFLISAFLMMGGLIILFNILGSQSITGEKKFLDTQLTDKTAKNIMNEYFFMTGVATTKSNVTKYSANYAANFSDYIRAQLNSRIFYAIVFVNSSQQYSLNMGNYLNRAVNVTVTATNSNPSTATIYLNDRKNSTVSFTALAFGTVNVTLNYFYGDKNVTESFDAVISQKNFIKSFFDLTITESNVQINMKDTYNRTWS